MTYTVLFICHAKDMQKRTYMSHQCRTRVDTVAETPGFCSYDSCKTFWCNFSTGLPLPGIGIEELKTIRDPRNKIGSNCADPCWTDQPLESTSPATWSIFKRFRCRSSNSGTGQGEGTWIKDTQNFALFFPENQIVFVCINCGRHINCLYRQRRMVRSFLTLLKES